MLGYSKYNDWFENVLVIVSWVILAGILFGTYLVYCGFTTMYARDGELIGQAKKLTRITPFWSSICPEYYAFDVSLGVLQNGVGSISKSDVVLTVQNVKDLPAMRTAVERGALVKVRYDTRRLAACTESYLSTGFEVIP